MMGINYDSPRKFLVSFGLSLIFVSFLVYFGVVALTVNGTISLFDMLLSYAQDPAAMEGIRVSLEDFFEIADQATTLASYVSMSCSIVGGLLFVWGMLLWNKEKENWNPFRR
jgi:hypothetical protein